MKKGDYVLATKWHDGDPGDQWAVGFYAGSFDHFGQIRHLVVDSEGKQFRRGGFRRVEKISAARGKFICDHLPEIEASISDYRSNKKGCLSLWGWKRQKMESDT